MAAIDLPEIVDIDDMLRLLRSFRYRLSGSAQRLLDSLVAAGLGLQSGVTPEPEIDRLWAVYARGRQSESDSACDRLLSWHETPWAQAYAERSA